jgi:hypothetical protein
VKAVFWIRHEKHLEATDWRENDLALAIQDGAKTCGDEVEIRETTSPEPVVVDCDLMLGIGCKSRYRFQAYEKAGIPYAYFDKGFIRTRAPIKWLDYWRVSVNGHQPVAYVERAHNGRERADSMGLDFSPWYSRSYPDHSAILLDGSSGKHMAFHDMGDPQNVAEDLFKRIRDVSSRPVIYRPKPSFRRFEDGGKIFNPKPIAGSEWARGRPGIHNKDVAYDLRRSHVVVTHGSNLCFDAALLGIPSIVLGHGIAGPISSQHLEELENPRLASDDERREWLNNVAYCQFKLAEFKSGLGWQAIKDMMVCHEEKVKEERLNRKIAVRPPVSAAEGRRQEFYKRQALSSG